MPAQPTPITVQDGFAEYNWTSDMFINNTTGHSLFLYGVNSVAVIHDGKNKTSTMSLSGGPTSETDFSPFGFPANSISLQVSVNLTGNLTYDLHPSSAVVDINAHLPSYRIVQNNTSANGSSSTSVYDCAFAVPWIGCEIDNVSETTGISPLTLHLLNDSRDLRSNYHFSTEIDALVVLSNLCHNVTYPITFNVTLNGLEAPIYTEIVLNLRGTD